MVRPESMVHCRIVASKQQLSTVINTLYELGLCHIKAHQKNELDIGQPLEQAEELSKLLLGLRAILGKFPAVTPRSVPPLTLKSVGAIKKGFLTLHSDFKDVEEQGKELLKQDEEIKGEIRLLTLIKEWNVDFLRLQDSRVLCSFFGTVKTTEQLVSLPEVWSRQKGNFILVVGRKDEESIIQTVLSSAGYSSLPSIPLHGLDARLIQCKARQKKVHAQLVEIQKKEQKIRKELPLLAGVAQQLQEEIRKQELPLSFAVTKSSFVAEGWIPEKESTRVRSALEKASRQAIHVEFHTPGKKEEPPVKLKNQLLVSPFEFFLHLYDLPRYRELDPTSYIFLLFPVFFGYMLGDAGYGLVLLGAFFFLKKKMGHIPEVRQLASILIYAATVSILFGLVFGEYFGFEHFSLETGRSLCQNVGICLPQHTIESHGAEKVIADFPRLLNRTHSHMDILGYEILSVLAIGAIIGFFHLNMGLLIGFVNEFKSHGFIHALEAKLSWIIMEAGIILAIVGAFTGIPWWIGTGVALLGIVLLGKGEGVQGLVEIPALFSNMLSYMRLGAVGLASVGLAVVVNENLALPMMEKGGVFILLGIIVMLLGHGINILLGVIGPFLHSIRLHYVEFFSKFYRGGGEEYQPFAKAKIMEVQ